MNFDVKFYKNVEKSDRKSGTISDLFCFRFRNLQFRFRNLQFRFRNLQFRFRNLQFRFRFRFRNRYPETIARSFFELRERERERSPISGSGSGTGTGILRSSEIGGGS